MIAALSEKRMRSLSLLFLLLIPISSFSDEADDVIHSLGLTKEDFRDIWLSGRCSPSWSVEIKSALLDDRELLGYKGLSTGFFKKEGGEDLVSLQAGDMCAALNQYYFNDVSADILETFITQDKEFITKHGYSVVDAIYIENTQFYSMNGEIDKFKLKYANELVRKGLFTINRKKSTFNGAPSISYFGERTSLGDKFHASVFE